TAAQPSHLTHLLLRRRPPCPTRTHWRTTTAEALAPLRATRSKPRFRRGKSMRRLPLPRSLMIKPSWTVSARMEFRGEALLLLSKKPCLMWFRIEIRRLMTLCPAFSPRHLADATRAGKLNRNQRGTVRARRLGFTSNNVQFRHGKWLGPD